jgi:ceramide glucosyltransferase
MAIVFGLLTLCSLGYCALALWSARNFRRGGRTHLGGFAPPVTILKPLKGTDPSAYESLRSHCVQEYPEYELIFGVNDDTDPAAELVRRLMAEFESAGHQPQGEQSRADAGAGAASACSRQ